MTIITIVLTITYNPVKHIFIHYVVELSVDIPLKRYQILFH